MEEKKKRQLLKLLLENCLLERTEYQSGHCKSLERCIQAEGMLLGACMALGVRVEEKGGRIRILEQSSGREVVSVVHKKRI